MTEKQRDVVLFLWTDLIKVDVTRPGVEIQSLGERATIASSSVLYLRVEGYFGQVRVIRFTIISNRLCKWSLKLGLIGIFLREIVEPTLLLYFFSVDPGKVRHRLFVWLCVCVSAVSVTRSRPRAPMALPRAAPAEAPAVRRASPVWLDHGSSVIPNKFPTFSRDPALPAGHCARGSVPPILHLSRG